MLAMFGLIVLLLTAGALLIALMTTLLVRGVTQPPRHTDGYALARNMPTDPSDLDLRFESWMLDRPDGTSLPVWEIDLHRPDSSQLLTLVMVHGWGQSKIDMLARLEVYRSIDGIGRVILYDMRGHGEEASRCTTLGARDDDDLLALLEQIGSGPVLLAGHSMGAQIAMRAMAQADDSVRETVRGVIAKGVFDDFHRSMRNRLRVRGYPTRPMTDLAMLWLRLTGRTAKRVLSVAEHVSRPTLVLHGTDDVTAPIDEARAIAERLPNAEFVELAGAGHLDAHTRAASEFETALRRFVMQLHDPTNSQRTDSAHD